MSNLPRKTAVQFGSGAGFQQIAQFGSLAAAAAAFSTDPAVIQGLSQWVDGWFSAILGGNSPAIEDMNAMSFVFGYQIAYLCQLGVAEWDAGTTYNVNSIVNSGGVLYTSLVASNTNHAVNLCNYWLPVIPNKLGPTIQTFTTGSGTYIPTYIFTILSGSATVGATYTNNAQTFTVSSTISSGTVLVTTGTGAPTSTGTLTKASGTGASTLTFGLVSQPRYIKVQMVGGGGGGGGSGSSGGAGGTAGNNTTFGSTFLIATGGAGGGPTAYGPGIGGTPTGGDINVIGGDGGAGAGAGGGILAFGGGYGGTSFFGGGGVPGFNGAAGYAAEGYGSGGGGASTTSAVGGSGGGGAGGYLEKTITTLSASYAYVVGASAAGGAGGASGENGGAGAGGLIYITEYY